MYTVHCLYTIDILVIVRGYAVRPNLVIPELRPGGRGHHGVGVPVAFAECGGKRVAHGLHDCASRAAMAVHGSS